MSEDMDLAQLVSDCVSLWRPGKEELLELTNFEEVVGVPKSLFVLKKALVGDTSDNITGIRGVGEKRARDILSEARDSLGSLDGDEGVALRSFRSYCEEHKSKPVRRIAEDFRVVARNILAMDLTKFPWEAGDLKTLHEKVTRDISFEPEIVRSMFKQLGFESLLGNFSAWVQPFRMLR
jgi:5'-3' exonuclease